MSQVLGDDDDPTTDHHHDHDHGHGHEHWPEWERARGGPVVVDVGDDVGALIVTIESGRVGSEVFIRPTDRTDDETHVAVWERALPNGRRVTAAVFGSLPAGTYTLTDRPGGSEFIGVTITGGVVAEHHLPAADVPAAMRADHAHTHRREHTDTSMVEDRRARA